MSMSRGDVARVLAAMALIDKRTVDENDIRMWYGLIPGDITVEQAVQGIKLYYQQHTKPMMPAQLIQYARTARPEQPDIGHHGEPGETRCRKCGGIHFPHEDCSVLMTMAQYGIERFVGEYNARRAANGQPPMSTRAVKRLMDRNGGPSGTDVVADSFDPDSAF